MSLSDALSLVAMVVIGLGGLLLPKYLVAKVTEAARGAVDERVGKTLERYSRDYSLFATKRNDVYAETFGLLVKVQGLYGPYFSIMRLAHDFSKDTPVDLIQFMLKDPNVTPGEREELQRHLDNDRLDKAQDHAAAVHTEAELRRAYAAFCEFKNASVLNSLYYSAAVNRLLVEAIGILGEMVAFSMHLHVLERHERDKLPALLKELDGVIDRVRDAMRSEMQAGFQG